MKNGNRVFYDNDSGFIIYQTYDSIGTIPPKINGKVEWIDLPYECIDYNKYYIASINPIDRKPVIVMMDGIETPEQKYIRELEDLIMLASDKNLGGIL